MKINLRESDGFSDERVSVESGKLLLGESTENERSLSAQELEVERVEGKIGLNKGKVSKSQQEILVFGLRWKETHLEARADDEIEELVVLLRDGGYILRDDEVLGLDTELLGILELPVKTHQRQFRIIGVGGYEFSR